MVDKHTLAFQFRHPSNHMRTSLALIPVLLRTIVHWEGMGFEYKLDLFISRRNLTYSTATRSNTDQDHKRQHVTDRQRIYLALSHRLRAIVLYLSYPRALPHRQVHFELYQDLERSLYFNPAQKFKTVYRFSGLTSLSFSTSSLTSSSLFFKCTSSVDAGCFPK